MNTILVVEDLQSLRNMISLKLKSAGYNVIEAVTAKEVLELLQSQKPAVNLFWLDHYLPHGMTGIDLISHIRQIPDYLNIPIIVVSNTPWVGSVLSYTDCGIEKYFVKSEHSLDEIIDSIKSVIEKPSEKQLV